MQVIKQLCVILFALVAVSCSGAPIIVPLAASPTVPPTASTGAALAKTSTLKIEVPADFDALDIPRLMAIDSLKAQGHTIQPVSFSDETQTIVALGAGQMDIGG